MESTMEMKYYNWTSGFNSNTNDTYCQWFFYEEFANFEVYYNPDYPDDFPKSYGDPYQFRASDYYDIDSTFTVFGLDFY